MLFLRPELVRLTEASCSKPVLDSAWHHSEYGGRVSMYRRFQRLTASGAMGDPSAASADKGRSIFDAVVDAVSSYLDDFATWPELPVLRRSQ